MERPYWVLIVTIWFINLKSAVIGNSVPLILRGSQSQKALPKNQALQKSIHHYLIS